MAAPNNTALGFDGPIQSGLAPDIVFARPPKPLAPPLKQIWPRTSILRARSEVDRTLDYLSKLKLQPHDVRPRNWDSLIALEAIVNSFGTDARILDAGLETYSVMLPWLIQFGFRNLYGINTIFQDTFVRRTIVYLHGNVEKMPFQAGHFDAVTCLSVLQQRVNIKRYLSESWRILKRGGLLISSVGYWDSGVDAGDRTQYGVPLRIFSREGILELVRLATEVGFEVIGDCALDCEEGIMHWRPGGLEYTFVILTMRKLPT